MLSNNATWQGFMGGALGALLMLVSFQVTDVIAGPHYDVSGGGGGGASFASSGTMDSGVDITFQGNGDAIVWPSGSRWDDNDGATDGSLEISSAAGGSAGFILFYDSSRLRHLSSSSGAQNLQTNGTFIAPAIDGLAANSLSLQDVDQLDIAQGSIPATCTAISGGLGDVYFDTDSTDELCFCTATNTWACISVTTTSGPTD